MIKLKSYAAQTHQGPHLAVNEDDIDIDLSNKLYLLLDGFGGAGIGDKATKESKETIKTFYTRISSDPDSTLPFFYSYKYLIEGNALINAFHCSHSKILKTNSSLEMSERGGCSVLGVAQSENVLSFVSTGNCVAYLLRNGSIATVCVPDILGSMQEIETSNTFQSFPLSGIGLFPDLYLTTKEVKVQNGDLIILMTDGIYCRTSPKEVRALVEQNDIPFNKKISELFNIANTRGNLDNQSAILLKY